MNKIIEEARELGISLVGWVECNNHGSNSIARHAANGDDASISYVVDGYWVWWHGQGYTHPATTSLAEALEQANATADSLGGWAPAPIGYVPAPPEVKSDAV